MPKVKNLAKKTIRKSSKKAPPTVEEKSFDGINALARKQETAEEKKSQGESIAKEKLRVSEEPESKIEVSMADFDNLMNLRILLDKVTVSVNGVDEIRALADAANWVINTSKKIKDICDAGKAYRQEKLEKAVKYIAENNL